MGDSLHQLKESRLIVGYRFYLRAVSLFCLFCASIYWVRLVGYYPGDLWRFETMPVEWRTLSVCLAVIYPVAACGLWMASRWGTLLWICAACAESLAMTVYASIFEWVPRTAFIHIVSLLIFVVFRLVIFISSRKTTEMTTAY